MNGKTCTFTVSGTGTTTYYAKAQAAASAGGSAYVSFTSAASATSASDTRNSGVVSTTSASAAAYYKAVPATGYVFLGWTLGSASSYSTSTSVSTSTTYTPSVTYSSENSSSPTTVTYKAWFAPMFYFSASATPSNESFGTTTTSVSTSVQGEPDESTKTVTATFTAAPKTDCTFNGWYENSSYTGDPVSTDATYAVTLNNTSPGSTTTKNLYALFKTTQNLQWNVDATIVTGMEVENAATVISGKTITYTSDDSDVIEVVNGKLKAKELGTTTITATVASDLTYNGATISRPFTVADKLQAVFDPAWGASTSTSIELGGTTTINLTNIATDGTFTITNSDATVLDVTRDGDVLTLTALKAGTATLKLTQTERAYIYGAETPTYTITVTKHANDFAVAASTKSMEVGDVWTSIVTANTGNGNPIQATYAPEGSESIATYDAENNKITALSEGSTTITLTQAATATHAAATKTIAVTVTKVTNTLTVTPVSFATEVGETITATIAGRNNEGTDIVAEIHTDSISPIKDSNYEVITYANGVITARNAGRATIKFSQAATTKYTGYESDTYEITVSKKSNSITITNLGGGTATNIKLKYNATAALAYTSTNTDTSPVVTRTSGSYTSYSNGTITAGNTAGTDIYAITQAETYKYEAGYATFAIRVNNTDEAVGYVLYHNKKEDWGTWGEWESPTLAGPADVLIYQAYKNGYGYFFVMASKDNGANYTDIDNPDLTNDDYKTYTNQLDEDVNRVKFETRVGATLHKWMNNIFVTRKTYVRASANKTALGTLYTDQTASATFTVNYSSTNGGNINIQSSNPHFVPSTSSIEVESNKTATGYNDVQYICGVDGTRTFTVTYTPDPDNLGTESAVITIGDLFYSQQITLTATSRKYDTSIARGTNTAMATTVDGTISGNVFAFSGTSTATPTANSSDDFYYTISHTQTSSVNNGDDVISYNPATNSITGLNAGTARLTIYQKKTLKYHATSQSFDFTVTKLANNVTIALSATEFNVDGTATVQLTNNDSDGALSASVTNISYTNESQNREGGLASFAAGTLTGVNAGTATVTITQAETYKYVAKSQQFTVTINKLAQTLMWDDPDLTTTMQVNTSLAGNTATSSVGLTPVTYSSGNTAVITVGAETGVLTAVATGSGVGITATQAGNYKYLPATLTRQFSVFNKQTPAFATDGRFTGTDGRVEQTCTATITVTGVGADSDEGFTITNGNSTIISAVRDGETITITGLAVGSTTLTLTQTGNDDYLAKTQTYNIEVYWPNDFLALAPDEAPSYDAGSYRKIFLQRTLKVGYTTLALPFATTVEDIVGDDYDEVDDWVAQLQTVTRTAVDNGTVNEYTLYFRKVDGGAIAANQPYVLHLGTAVVNPTWTDLENGITVSAASAGEHAATTGYSDYDGWVMHANYDADFAMTGKYGIVNTAGGLMLGGSGSTLAAFTAYIAPPAQVNNAPRLRVAYVDTDGTTTVVDDLPFDNDADAQHIAIYGPDGKRRSRLQPGVNIVRQADGTVRKVQR